MPVNRKDLQLVRASLSKDLVAVQNFVGITCRLNTAGQVFNADGLSTGANSTSSFWMVHAGGFDDQRITASMKYVSPTSQASSQLGVVARVQSFEQASDQNYYWARVQAGVARLSKAIGGSFTNLASQAWALPQGQYATITLSCVGNQITATFHDESNTLADVTLNATDSAIPTGGLMGFRSLSSSIAVKSFLAEQL